MGFSGFSASVTSGWAREQAAVIRHHAQPFEWFLHLLGDFLRSDVLADRLHQGAYLDTVLVGVIDDLINLSPVTCIVADFVLRGFVAVEAGSAGHGHLGKTALFDQRQVLHWQAQGLLGVGAVGGAAAAAHPALGLDQF